MDAPLKNKKATRPRGIGFVAASPSNYVTYFISRLKLSTRAIAAPCRRPYTINATTKGQDREGS